MASESNTLSAVSITESKGKGGSHRRRSEVSNVGAGAIDESLLHEFLEDEGVDISTAKFLQGLQKNGLRPLTDPRFKDMINKIKKIGNDSIPEVMMMDDFKKCISSNMVFITQALSQNLIIPKWNQFCDKIKSIYEDVKTECHGNVASLTPQMAKVNPEKYAVSICTVDGQRFSLGDYKDYFPLQDLNRVLLYTLACTEKSVDYVHQYIGKEPSGSEGDALALKNGKPHNPLLLTGGLTLASLLKPKLCFSERFEYFLNKTQQFCGNENVGFNNSLALALKDHSNRLYAIGHYLRENDCFNKDSSFKADSLEQTMELFIHYSAIQMTSDAAAVMAATLAFGGLCPLSGEKVVYPEAVRNCLSMMNCCGVNDHSGEFMFEVGLPAKSNVSGAIIVVIPNVLGMCIWSPRLDRSMNSVRAIKFCKKFTDLFVFHQFDPTGRGNNKLDPRRRDFQETKDQQSLILLFAAFHGNMTTLYRYLKEGINFGYPDYDGRTALHLAVCGGQLDVVKFLIEKCHVDVNPIDRWENTPLDDAYKYNFGQIIFYLQKKGSQKGAQIMNV